MPSLWTDTVDDHRRAVRDAALNATAALVAKHGLASVTMSAIAEAAGIGRATLYKYFPDIDAIVVAWHERHLAGHLAHLEEIRDQARPADRLRTVLEAYARMSAHQAGERAAALHQGDHVAKSERRLQVFVRDIIAEAAKRREVRTDVPPTELAAYCLHALMAAAALPSRAAVDRLVALTLDALKRR